MVALAALVRLVNQNQTEPANPIMTSAAQHQRLEMRRLLWSISTDTTLDGNGYQLRWRMGRVL